MATFNLYCVRDKVQGFGSIFCEPTEASAIRGFGYMINSGNGLMSYKPDDYDLYVIGEYNTDTGVVTPKVPVEMVISGSSVFGV